ncbi:Tricarboxylate carrier-like protein [Elsinoe fawcettii]|nr:Tricarboxylate carrier-like protein [Elsinoe fawcettii]
MSASLPGSRELPSSQYNLDTYWGRVKESAKISDPRTLFTSQAGLEHAKSLVSSYKQGKIQHMTPDLWEAKKIVDSTLHPDTGEPVFLPFRMSCFVLSNLVVTGGMLTPNLGTMGTLGWQITNQSLNVGINASNANKSSPLTTSALAKNYVLAVSASCSVALGLNALVPRLKRVSPTTKVVLGRLVPFAAVVSAGILNIFLMRSEELRRGIDVYSARKPAKVDDSKTDKITNAVASVVSTPSSAGGPPLIDQDSGFSAPFTDDIQEDEQPKSLGKSKKAATIAVAETAASRVFNAAPIMALPPIVLLRLQKMEWLKQRPRMVTPVNLGLILTTSIFALPVALGAFPQRERIKAGRLEEEFWDKVEGGKEGMVEFNRGI